MNIADQELIDSIAKVGVIEALLVRESSGPSKRSIGRYVVVDGNRRLRACKKLNSTPVPCKVMTKDTNVLRDGIEHIPLNKISERRK